MEKSSFFNSVNGDRKYKASDFAEFFNSLVTNGVFPNPSTNLQIISNNNMTVTIRVGKGWINGYIYINDTNLVLPIEVADGVLNRIDRIALRMDTAGRAINAVVKKGTFASNPVAPTLERDADYYELGIADIYIGAGVTSVVQANITDLRMNTLYCGWVNSLIQADTTAIFNQYQNWFTTQSTNYNTQMSANEADFTAQFNTWFNGIKNTLGSDVAGNLLNQINSLAGNGRTTETVKGNSDKIAILNGTGNVVEKANKSDFESYLANYSTDIGVANAYQITLNPAPTVYEIGKIYKFKATNANTGASTFQIGTLTATAIKKNVSMDLASGDIVAGQIVSVVYDGTYFQFIGVTNAERTVWNAKLDKSGGIMTGTLVAQNNTAYTTAQVRNQTLSTSAPSGGGNGDIWFVYTA